MNAQDAITRLCHLQADVTERLGHDLPADCFCGLGVFWNKPGYDGTEANGFRNDGRSLEFIEYATRRAIEALGSCDGNHAEPACADPQCWQLDEPLRAFR